MESPCFLQKLHVEGLPNICSSETFSATILIRLYLQIHDRFLAKLMKKYFLGGITFGKWQLFEYPKIYNLRLRRLFFIFTYFPFFFDFRGMGLTSLIRSIFHFNFIHVYLLFSCVSNMYNKNCLIKINKQVSFWQTKKLKSFD